MSMPSAGLLGLHHYLIKSEIFNPTFYTMAAAIFFCFVILFFIYILGFDPFNKDAPDQKFGG